MDNWTCNSYHCYQRKLFFDPQVSIDEQEPVLHAFEQPSLQFASDIANALIPERAKKEGTGCYYQK